MGRHDEWVARDATVVWHGFTQMDAFAENAPVVVERGEGHELIDVDGRRYLDAISSLWVNTLGHTVPELDDAVREQLGRGAHSTMLGNGNVAVVELAEALARVVPVDDPHFLFASDGAAAVEQALKIAFQYWVNRGAAGHTQFLAFGGTYHGDTIGALSVGDAAFGTDLFDPLRFPVLRAPQFGEPGCFDTAVAMVAAHAHELAAVIVEPLVQGAAGMLLADPDGLRALEHTARSTTCSSSATRSPPGSGAPAPCSPRSSATSDPTCSWWGRASPPATCRCRRPWPGDGVRRLPRPRPLRAHAVPRAFVLGERAGGRGGAPAPRAARRVVGAPHRPHPLRRVAAALLVDRVAPHPAVAEVRLCGLMGGVELAPPHEGMRWGRRVCTGAVDRGVLLRPLGDVVVLMPPLTVTSAELHRMVQALTEALDEVVA